MINDFVHVISLNILNVQIDFSFFCRYKWCVCEHDALVNTPSQTLRTLLIQLNLYYAV